MFNYNKYYEEKNEIEEEEINDKKILLQIYKKNKEFYRTETYKRFFL